MGYYPLGADKSFQTIDAATNGNLLPPLVQFLAENPKINRAGRLFILTSRRTFSAAAMFSAMMQNRTEAILVGEATAQGPNFFSQPQVLKLSNSGMEFLVSSMWTPSSMGCDVRSSIQPDLPVAYTWQDHVTDRDPGMEAAQAYWDESSGPLTPDPVLSDSVVGRYRLNLLELLEIRSEQGGLRLQITDFLENSKVRADKELFQVGAFELRDSRGALGVRLPVADGPADSLTFLCYGSEEVVQRLSDGELYAFEMLQEGRIEDMAAEFRAAAAKYTQAIPRLEAILNSAGYDHLGRQDYPRAIALFRLNVDLFPESANVYDSLGEAFMLDGQRELAIRNYQLSLELNPANANAEEKLQELGASAALGTSEN